MVKIFYKIAVFFSVFVFLPSFVFAAELSISPSIGDFEVGDQIIIKVIASSKDIQFNAVSSTILFPASIFEIESVSKENSILNFWTIEPIFFKSLNIVKFEGISLGGVKVPTGTVITVSLRAIKAGSGDISFKSGKILANDGKGTDITGDLIGGSFFVKEVILEPLITISKKSTKKSVQVPIIEMIHGLAPTLTPTSILIPTLVSKLKSYADLNSSLKSEPELSKNSDNTSTSEIISESPNIFSDNTIEKINKKVIVGFNKIKERLTEGIFYLLSNFIKILYNVFVYDN